MTEKTSKRTAVLWLMMFFLAADIAASFWVDSDSTALSHTVWDICGVGLAYFVLRAFFDRRSMLLPAAACGITMAMRAAQCTGATSVLFDSDSLLGELLDRNALAGDMIACIPVMITVMLMLGMEKHLKEKQVPPRNALIAFAVMTAVFLLTAFVPLILLPGLAVTVVISKSETPIGDAVCASAYVFGGAIFAMAGYAILAVQFAVLTLR